MNPPNHPVTHIRLTRRGEWIPATPIEGGVHIIINHTNHWYRWNRIAQAKNETKSGP